MSFNKSVLQQLIASDLQRLVDFMSNEPNNRPKLPGYFVHPFLVQVNSGDGIGFDADDLVAISNRRNNVLLIVKDNYKFRFEPHKALHLNRQAICHVQDLVPGHTYLIGDIDSFAFSKYLGHSMALIRTADTCDVLRIDGDEIPPHYELSVPVSK